MKLTPEEKKIIDRTKREGEEFYESEHGRKEVPGSVVVRNTVLWVVMIVVFVFLAWMICYLGSLWF